MAPMAGLSQKVSNVIKTVPDQTTCLEACRKFHWFAISLATNLCTGIKFHVKKA